MFQWSGAIIGFDNKYFIIEQPLAAIFDSLFFYIQSKWNEKHINTYFSESLLFVEMPYFSHHRFYNSFPDGFVCPYFFNKVKVSFTLNGFKLFLTYVYCIILLVFIELQSIA